MPACWLRSQGILVGYGAKFDESHGAKKAEEWQERLEEIDAAA
jgi:hypothetical protein